MPKQTFKNLSEAKRDTILNVAVDEFAHRGYEAASISKIVSNAGIAKGSFYQYFEDKRDLFLYLIDEASRKKARFLEEQHPPEPESGPFEYLHWLFKTGMQFDFVNPRMMKVAQEAFDGTAPLPENIRQRVTEQSTAFLRRLLLRGIESGHLRKDLDVDAASFVLFTVTRHLNAYVMAQLNITYDEPDPLTILRAREDEVEVIFSRLLGILRDGMAHNGK